MTDELARRAAVRLAQIVSNQEIVRWQIPTPILPQAEFQAQKRAMLLRNPLICMVPAPGIEPGTY